MFTCERSSRPKAIPGPAVLATAGLSRSVAGCPSRCGQTLCSLRSDRQLLCLPPERCSLRPDQQESRSKVCCRSCPDPLCRSEEHTSELQSLRHLVCRLLLEK